jgi:hypothetical protein
VWITDNTENIWQTNTGHWNVIGTLNGGLNPPVATALIENALCTEVSFVA